MNTSLAAARRTSLAAATALASFGLSPAAQALGLGNINVLSGLNQPLRAVVPLLLEEDETPDQITLAIARDDEANKFGALPNLLGQELDVVISLQGERIEALITTEFPVKEPHVDVVLHAQMGDTKHLRIYPVLLDLPIGYFEPEIDDSYLEANINARTNWDGKPSDQQRDQMNEPAAVSSLKVDGNTIEPIQVGSAAPTPVDVEAAYNETTTYIAAREDDVAREREIADNEISAIQLTAGTSSVGVALDTAVDEATVADLPTDDSFAEFDSGPIELDERIAAAVSALDSEAIAAVPVEEVSDEAVPVAIDVSIDTSEFADVEVGDDAGAVLPVAPAATLETEPLETPVRVYPQVKPTIPVTLTLPEADTTVVVEEETAASTDEKPLEAAKTIYEDRKPTLTASVTDTPAATPIQVDTQTTVEPTLDLAEWAGTDAKLPLPEDVLLAEVPDEIGAPVKNPEVPRSEALRVIQTQRAPAN